MSAQKATKHDELSIKPDEIDRTIARELIENPSITDESLGLKIGLCRQTTNKRRNSPEVRAAYAELISIPKKDIKRVVYKAYRRLESLIDDPDPRVALQAAIQILKMGIDMRDDLKASDGWLLGLTPLEQKLKELELEMKLDTATTIHDYRQYQLREQLNKIIEAEVRRNIASKE